MSVSGAAVRSLFPLAADPPQDVVVPPVAVLSHYCTRLRPLPGKRPCVVPHWQVSGLLHPPHGMQAGQAALAMSQTGKPGYSCVCKGKNS